MLPSDASREKSHLFKGLVVFFGFVSISPPFPSLLLPPPSPSWRNIVNIYFFVGDLESISDVCALKLNVSIKGKKQNHVLRCLRGGGLGWGSRGGSSVASSNLSSFWLLFGFDFFIPQRSAILVFV